MPRQPTFREKLTSWEILSSNLGANLQSFPTLTAQHTAFASLITQGLALVARQEAAEAQYRQLIQDRLDLETRGNHAREHLVASLRAALGVSSPLLLGYDIRPRVSRRRPRPEPTEPPIEKPPGGTGEDVLLMVPLDPNTVH